MTDFFHFSLFLPITSENRKPAEGMQPEDPKSGNGMEPENSKSTDWTKLRSNLVLWIAVPILLSVVAYFWSRSNPSCDMQQASNRNFNNYYGIINMTNHFADPTADACNARIVFSAAMPQAILKADNTASSFLVLAKYGTGKTLLRCEYINSLSPEKFFKAVILNKQISEYLDRYILEVKKKEIGCEKSSCLSGWSGDHFAQSMLSVLVTEFIDEYHSKKLTFPQMALHEKIDLVTIICYYYNGVGTSRLESFINSFLEKKSNSEYRAIDATVEIPERNVHFDKPLYARFKSDLQEFLVLKKDLTRFQLLLHVIEGENFTQEMVNKYLHGKVLQHLVEFSLFIKSNLHKSVVFVIDGIDENGEFFHDNKVRKGSLESFGRASVSQEILALVMAQHFHLSIFYPKIDGINIEDAIIKKDKFPTYKIKWSTKSILNYADYVLQEMNKDASNSRCVPFTDFETLVNFSNRKVAEIIQKIPTPRALHFFVIALIGEMNDDAKSVKPPFIATFKNVLTAYDESVEYFEKRHKMME